MKKAENTGNYIDISFSNKRNNVFLLLLYKSYYLNLVTFAVAPLAGAWVEIIHLSNITRTAVSLPSRERGLKFRYSAEPFFLSDVAPLAGAWVEIDGINVKASYMNSSLPSRERGLKSENAAIIRDAFNVAPLAGAWVEIKIDIRILTPESVAPLAGAWVEISTSRVSPHSHICRSPRGSVG